MEEDGWDACFNISFSPVSAGEEGEKAALCCQTTSAALDEGWSFDGALETLS